MATECNQDDASSAEKTLIVSAPGKIILHGEHAVVYGKTALAAGLNLRSYLQLTETTSSRLQIRLPDIDLSGSWNVEQLHERFQDLSHQDVSMASPPSATTLQQLQLFLGYEEAETTKQMALLAFLYMYLRITGRNGKLPSLDVLVSSVLPPGAGLGSSAAFSVCLAAGLLTFSKAITPKATSGNILEWSKADLDCINAWAFEGERLIHGNPSGIDNSISVLGRAIKYKSKTITPIEDMPELSILLINTKVPRSTKELVAGVRKRHDKYPKIYGPILDSIEEISQECMTTLRSVRGGEGDGPAAFQRLENLVDINQELLRVIGVSHPAIDNVCRSAAAYEIHAKLTGAGGGGCVFALIPPYVPQDSVRSLQEDLHFQNYDSWVTSLGARGVVMHQSKETLVQNKKEYLLPDSFLQ